MIVFIILIFLAFVGNSQTCYSFSSFDLYYDINQGNTNDKVINILDANSNYVATLYYNLCQNVAQVCTLYTLQADNTTIATDYQVTYILFILELCSINI